jgi:glycosyltransferase involved in cell wall biosynthesis
MIKMFRNNSNVHILLGGWRRQYLISRLEDANVPYTYFERASQEVLRELYQCADLYIITALCEGGPQALIECGLMNTPVITTPVGIAEQVLPASSINLNVALATPAIPNVEHMKLPHGINQYEEFFQKVYNGEIK